MSCVNTTCKGINVSTSYCRLCIVVVFVHACVCTCMLLWTIHVSFQIKYEYNDDDVCL